MEGLRAHLQAGKPLVGLRTASHAFALRSGERTKTGEKGELMAWPEFDPEVLGGNYAGHHGVGPMTTVTAAPGAAAHPILKGVNLADLVGHGSLYKVNPLKASAQPLLMGSVPGQAPEPVAWTHRYGPRNARIFYTSLGHPDDFKSPEFRRLLLNGIAWAVE
jgi:type 1 glutamine amidotransferase